MAQHIDIAVCAHVSCWAILRYYSATFPQHREYLLHDITKLVAPFDPGGLLPSLGFSVLEAERVFHAAGCFPLRVDRRDASSAESFFSQFLAYLESGFPLFVEIPSKAHAVVIVGHSWKKMTVSPQASPSHVWTQVETLLTVDDNLLPYATVPLHSSPTLPQLPSYSADSFDSFIVALPEKIYCLRLAGRGEKIHENVCRYDEHVPIREVWRARRATAATLRILGLSGTRGTCGASNASSGTRRS